MFKRTLIFFRKKLCRHEFNIEDITLTGIKPPEVGKYNYITDTYSHDYITKRVCCECRKCNQFFYASCGLSLKGKLTRKSET